MAEKHRIIYYADDMSLGDCTAEQCNRYRAWVQREIETEYPEHDITVSYETSARTVDTDDLDREYAIMEYCSRLWDRAPWEIWED